MNDELAEAVKWARWRADRNELFAPTRARHFRLLADAAAVLHLAPGTDVHKLSFDAGFAAGKAIGAEETSGDLSEWFEKAVAKEFPR